MHILLIEDNPDFGESLVTALRHEGHIVEWQRQAYDQPEPQQEAFDLVINGWEDAIKNQDRLSELPQWAQASLQAAQEKVKEANRAVEIAQGEAMYYKRMAANLSHELKTPIAAILTTAQTMLRCERTSDKYKQALRLCERNSRSMKQLIRRMLDLARAGSDSWEPTITTADPRDLLSTAIDLHAPLAQDDGVELLMVCKEGLKIDTDSDLLLIMINNLLGNAIRYTPRGKSVILRFAAQSKSIPATISVIDEGPGIRPEVLPHIFDAFYQDDEVKGHRQTHDSNYGLGLALTSELAVRLNIRIEVDSEPDQGAAFHLRLPTANPT